MQRSDLELWTSSAGTLVRPDETPPASLYDFIPMPRKLACWNSCKNLSTIQRSDQELRTSWSGTLVWSLVLPDQIVLVSSRNFTTTPRKTTCRNLCKNLSMIQRTVSFGDFIVTQWKQASWNSSKNLRTIQRSDQKLWTSWAGTRVWPEKTPLSWRFHCDTKQRILLKLL